jgi:hypothetical protein
MDVTRLFIVLFLKAQEPKKGSREMGIPCHQCRDRYMSSSFWDQLTWGFLRISVGRVPYICW